MEVTQDDFRRVTGSSNNGAASSKPPKNLTTRLNNLFHKNRSSNASMGSDRATVDSNDVESVAASTVAGNITVASTDTLKISNLTPNKPFYEQTGKAGRAQDANNKKNPWRKLKKMIGNKKESDDSDDDSPYPSGRSRSLSHPSVRSEVDNAYAMRRRVESDNCRTQQTIARESATNGQELDDAIRGRFDGMDILSLGSARLASTPRPPDLLTRDTPMLTAQDMVTDMLLMSAGRQPPELILEGFIASDRWLVRIETMNGDGSSVPQLQSTDDESSMDGSPALTTPKLLASIWGRDSTPPPSHANPEDVDGDDVFQLAASCSVPIDIDEETFIIDTPAHCQAVHDIAAVPLKVRVMEYCGVCIT